MKGEKVMESLVLPHKINDRYSIVDVKCEKKTVWLSSGYQPYIKIFHIHVNDVVKNRVLKNLRVDCYREVPKVEIEGHEYDIVKGDE